MKNTCVTHAVLLKINGTITRTGHEIAESVQRVADEVRRIADVSPIDDVSNLVQRYFEVTQDRLEHHSIYKRTNRLRIIAYSTINVEKCC